MRFVSAATPDHQSGVGNSPGETKSASVVAPNSPTMKTSQAFGHHFLENTFLKNTMKSTMFIENKTR